MSELSDLSPRIVSHPPNSQVHSRLLLVKGTCGSNTNGDIQISSHHKNFPTQSFPVRNGQFKALIHLSPGENNISMSYYDGHRLWVSSWSVCYIPLLQNPPLHLCIIVGFDSPLTYDDVPDCQEPPTLDTAIKKLRLAGYLWQAYTGSQMSSNGLGHRTFRLNESWQRDSLSLVDQSYRNTATIHVLRSKYTIAEIRDPKRAQQNPDAEKRNSLFDIALEAIKPEFSGEGHHIVALFLDSHFENGLITGHAALGSGSVTAQYSLAIFGSHSLFSWSSSLENVISCFMDERSVNTNYCGIDIEGNKYWIACNVGIGAMMHELGHLLGCPHQRSGVMMRDYIRLNRSFCVTEPVGPPALNGAECSWHRLDLLRFRTHPCFALPSDQVFEENEIDIFGIDQGILLKSPSKILLIEIYLEDDEFPKSWIEYVEKSPSEIILCEDELRSRADGKGKIKINVIGLNGMSTTIDDIEDLLQVQQVSGLGKVWKSAKLGLQTGSPSTILFPIDPLVKIRVHSGFCLDGLEFFTKQDSFLFGKRSGSPHDFTMEYNEFIRGFGVRSGAWIDALQIITNKRRSKWFGNLNGGSQNELIVPNNDYRVCGVYGEVQDWVMQIGLHYSILT
ncbi:unnamed protein product [Rotaria sp. Silwood2]|nr:unnamed protein product [Rotaria sp. Silwood2]CAF2962616.1 unnamed protein product [Rotaria sp. Silwood2]CAF3059666.1 unnamed protein product [Rotaria sp. Silwood2]CAF4349328.1 unnamed protein product [Rotaria sp. Silwood2]CAF4484417.1 unnamed protein product [Rotaria sp. Silwood2]